MAAHLNVLLSPTPTRTHTHAHMRARTQYLPRCPPPVPQNRLLDLSALRLFVLDEADDMIENFAADCMDVKRRAVSSRPAGTPPPQVLLFSASFECLEPSHPHANRAKNFTDQVRGCGVCVCVCVCV